MEITYRLSEIDQVAQAIIHRIKHDCVVLEAPMGAGKTTLIKSMCTLLGVEEGISSPTFSLVNEYKTASREILHFDLYRIEQPIELHEIGMEDYLDRKALKFIEWPELVLNMLDNYHRIAIEIIDQDRRKITFS
jgi:tRNA threonylcarbamoyladenosine biosynthesis protein TsaE